ncbi:MAG: Gfo/Idh/MocA family oxidoreductase, partial [Lachnospiraceae bacterium]|nr:Gfo/Idh/MocA family oxidoreductase [Lachnospiraceae bacterium]
MYQIGFIGGGINSAIGRSHFIASQMDGKFKVTAGVFSRNDEVNQRTGEEFFVDSQRVYKDYHRMLEEERGKLDAVAVLAPTDVHEEMVTACLRAGYPVICEKSLTTSYESALRIKACAEETKGFLCVTYNYTGYPMVRALRDQIQEGKLGKITNIIVEMPQEGYTRYTLNHEQPTPQEWRMVDYEIPTISLDLGTHLHNMMAFLTGAHPKEIVARESSFGFFPQVIDDVLCMINYSEDIAAQMWFSKAALGNRNGLRIRVFGTGASAEWYQAEPETLKINDKNGQILLMDRSNDTAEGQKARYNRFKAGHPGGFIEAYANYYWDMHDALSEYLEK